MIEDWRASLKSDPTPRLFKEITQAFKAAVATTKGEGGSQCRYKVADSSGRSYENSSCTILFGKFCQSIIYVCVSSCCSHKCEAMSVDQEPKKPTCLCSLGCVVGMFYVAVSFMGKHVTSYQPQYLLT